MYRKRKMATVSDMGYICQSKFADRLSVETADGLTIDGAIIPSSFTVSSGALSAGAAGSYPIFIAPAACQILSVKAVPNVDASAQADITVQKVHAATPVETLSAAINLNASGDLVPVAGTLTATAANLVLAAGDVVRVTLTGAATSLANAIVTVEFKRV